MLFVIEEMTEGGNHWLVSNTDVESARNLWLHETGNTSTCRIASLADIGERVTCRYVTAEAMIEADAVLSAYRRSADLAARLQ